MKCRYHPQIDAVATCQECGAGLCYECAGYFTTPFCPECVKSFTVSQKRQRRKSLITTVIAAIVLLLICSSFYTYNSIHLTIFQVLFVICIPFGWAALNKIQPQIFLFLPVIGWLIYFSIKLVASAIVGLGALPYVIVKYIKDSIAYNKQIRYCNDLLIHRSTGAI